MVKVTVEDTVKVKVTVRAMVKVKVKVKVKVMDTVRVMKNAYEMQVKKKWDKGKVLDIFFTRWSPEEKAKVLDGLKNGGTEGGVS